MKSFRVWFSGLALGAVMLFTAPSAKAQVPQGFTYQGLLEDGNVPISGTVTLTISISDKSGKVLYLQAFQNVVVANGMFDVVIGDSTAFPSTMTFNEQYFLTLVVTASGGTTTLPPTPLWDAPYAINAGTVNGISASKVPVAGDLFPVPTGTGYAGTLKMDPGFLPAIPNSLLGTPDITQINEIGPNTTGNFNIAAGSGIIITPVFNGITVTASNVVGNSSLSTVSFTVLDSEANGNDALLVRGGIGANNTAGTVDGSGLNSASPQTYWADRVPVPPTTGTSLQIFNILVSATSTIVITPVEPSASSAPLAITAQNDGTFTVSSTAILGNGNVTVIDYLVINH
jgi:hypothetical protein